jgi:hypothetical protein
MEILLAWAVSKSLPSAGWPQRPIERSRSLRLTAIMSRQVVYGPGTSLGCHKRRSLKTSRSTTEETASHSQRRSNPAHRLRATVSRLRVCMASNGVITTVAENGLGGFSGDGGPATSAQLFGSKGVAVDSAGNLFIADTNSHRIRRVSNGVITTVAGLPSRLIIDWPVGEFMGAAATTVLSLN